LIGVVGQLSGSRARRLSRHATAAIGRRVRLLKFKPPIASSGSFLGDSWPAVNKLASMTNHPVLNVLRYSSTSSSTKHLTNYAAFEFFFVWFNKQKDVVFEFMTYV